MLLVSMAIAMNIGIVDSDPGLVVASAAGGDVVDPDTDSDGRLM